MVKAEDVVISTCISGRVLSHEMDLARAVLAALANDPHWDEETRRKLVEYLVPEPEIPEAVKALMLPNSEHADDVVMVGLHNYNIVAAYNLGLAQNSQKEQ